ncbi:MAG: periplasmic heavy metal sensor [Candidatus Krumholzibacteriia bacterium]
MTNRRTMLVSCALVTLAASLAAAQPGPDRGGHRGREGWGPDPEPRIERLAQRLDLTAEQQTAILAIEAEARQAGRELDKELARLRNQRQGEMLKDEPSEKALVDLTEKMGAVRTKLQIVRLKARLAVRAQLTADQRDEMMLMGRHGRGRSGGCDGDGPGRGGPEAGRRGAGRGCRGGEGPRS